MHTETPLAAPALAAAAFITLAFVLLVTGGAGGLLAVAVALFVARSLVRRYAHAQLDGRFERHGNRMD